MGFIKHIIWSLCLLGIFSASYTGAQAPDVVTPPDKLPVIPDGGINLQDVRKVAPDAYEATLIDPTNPDFLYTFTDLPTTGDTTITIYLGKKGTWVPGTPAFWPGHNPVMTYGDPRIAQTYVYYTRSGSGELDRWSPKLASMKYSDAMIDFDEVPHKANLSDTEGMQFISRLETREQLFSPWRYVDAYEIDPAQGCFRLRQHFVNKQATLAFNVPPIELHIPSSFRISPDRTSITSVPVIDQDATMSVVIAGSPRDAASWPIGTLVGVATERETRLTFTFVGDAKKRAASYAAWGQLWPVFSYADAKSTELGQWWSRKTTTAPWVNGETQAEAGTGVTPTQTLSSKVATPFTATDGLYASPWREVDHIEMLPDESTFRLHQTFAQSTVTLAMGTTELKPLLEQFPKDKAPSFPTKELTTTATTFSWDTTKNILVRAVRPGVMAEPTDSFNVKINEQASAHELVLGLTIPCHNFWAMRLSHLPTDAATQFVLSLEGNDTENKADVRKSAGLRPVVTYADPDRYESYVYYTKDDTGLWVSGDPFVTDDSRYAGTGKTPTQQVMPADLAEECLSPDGKYWCPWFEIDSTIAPELNTLRLNYQFRRSTASVSMRVPYSYTLLQAYLERLKKKNLPGVTVEDISQSGYRKSLHYFQLIKVETPDPEKKPIADRPTILIYAREHATEADGTWGAVSLMNWLLSDKKDAVEARQKATWIIIPILDVNGSVDAKFDVADWFTSSKGRETSLIPQVFAVYAVDWINAGRRLDFTVNLHNIECGEGPNLYSPIVNCYRREPGVTVNTRLFAAAEKAGYTVGSPDKVSYGFVGLRFGSWCYQYLNSIDLAFELNTRAPKNSMNLSRIGQLGAIIGQQLYDYSQSADYQPIKTKMTAFVAKHAIDSAAWYKANGYSPDKRTLFDLFQGY